MIQFYKGWVKKEKKSLKISTFWKPPAPKVRKLFFDYFIKAGQQKNSDPLTPNDTVLLCNEHKELGEYL